MTSTPASPGAATGGLRAVSREARRFPVRPRFRGRELGLLALVGIALFVGAASLGATRQLLAAQLNGPVHVNLLAPADAELLAAYLGALLAVHVAFILAGRRTDQILLPTIGLLGGIGLLLMERLPQNLAGSLGGLAKTQLAWLVIGLTIVAVLGVIVRSDVWLRRYKYTWAAVGVGLLLLTFVFGHDVNGARLSLTIGPVSGQPSGTSQSTHGKPCYTS